MSCGALTLHMNQLKVALLWPSSGKVSGDMLIICHLLHIGVLAVLPLNFGISPLPLSWTVCYSSRLLLLILLRVTHFTFGQLILCPYLLSTSFTCLVCSNVSYPAWSKGLITLSVNGC